MAAFVGDRPPRIGLFTSTFPGHPVAVARLRHLNESLRSTHDIRLTAFHGATSGSALYRQYTHIRKLMMHAASDTTIDLAIIADDDLDAAPHAFDVKLSNAVRAMPSNWRLLHLCPGWRWGRKQRHSTLFALQRGLAKSSVLNWEAGMTPDVPTSELKVDGSGHLIVNVAELAKRRRVFHLGGPIAFAARPSVLPDVVRAYDAAWHTSKHTLKNDALLLNISTAADFVAFRPLLCIENEIGGSFYPRKSRKSDPPWMKDLERSRQALLEASLRGGPAATQANRDVAGQFQHVIAFLLVCVSVLIVGCCMVVRKHL
mmetsp:Transcript_40053/g.105904  ORF Transcript_40053/g.105904 Transcript_40053/m.105904 type:complete len:315 (-) Transcript_40053:86-1030(-)